MLKFDIIGCDVFHVREEFYITEDDLTQVAYKFLQLNYGLKLDIPIKRNNRLRTTLGRYVISHDDQPLRIEIAGNTLNYGTASSIIEILKHECIHYALHKKGLPYHDGDPLFEAELRKHHVPSTDTKIIGKYYLFRCQKCSHEGKTLFKRIVQKPDQYRTSCCNAPLKIIGEVIYDGEDDDSRKVERKEASS